MRCKRQCGKRKPKLAAAVGLIAKGAVQNVVSVDTQDEWGVDDFDNAEIDSRIEFEPQNVNNRTRQQSGARKHKVFDVTMEDSSTSFREWSVAGSANLSQRARSIMAKLSDGSASSSLKRSKNSEETQDEYSVAKTGHAYSAPRENTRPRCAKRGTKLAVGPMTDHIRHQEQDQTPNYSQPHQPSLKYRQPHQTQQVALEDQPSSGLPRPSQHHAAIDIGNVDSSSRKRGQKRGRGPTWCLDVWNMKNKIFIPTNELGQANGPNAPKLTNFLGTIARNGNLAPLNYPSWKTFPAEKKEQVWQLVQEKFDIDPKSKSWVLKSTGNKWKNWKASLKASHYNAHETDEMRLADLDERVRPDQWRFLVSFWNSKKAKELSLKNKTTGSKHRLSHTTGRKSFARIREEEREKRPDGREPSRADLFILTRTRKDGKPVNEESARVISQLRQRASQQVGNPQGSTIEDDVFFQVMGPDKSDRVRTYGLGPTPSDLVGPKRGVAGAIRLVSEANTEVREMKVKMESMHQTCAQMAAQMATMMSMMSAMHAKFPDKHLPNTVASPSQPSSAGLVEDVSAAPE